MQSLSLIETVAELMRMKGAKQRGRAVLRGDGSWHVDVEIDLDCCHQLQAAI